MKNNKIKLILIGIVFATLAIASCSPASIQAEASRLSYQYLTQPAWEATSRAVAPTMDEILRLGINGTATASAAMTQNGPKSVTNTRPCSGQSRIFLTVETYTQNNVKFWLDGTMLVTNAPNFGPFQLDGNWKQVGTIEDLCFRIVQDKGNKFLQILVKPSPTSTPSPSATPKRP
jgi:hypothetical protein